jgi:hypothetical protein
MRNKNVLLESVVIGGELYLKVPLTVKAIFQIETDDSVLVNIRNVIKP